MASIFSEDHESGTNGVDVATGNSGYTSFSATEPVFTNAQAITGSLGMLVNTTTAAVRCALYTHGSAQSVVYVRTYVYFDDMPPTSEFMRVKSNTTLRAECRFNASGNSGSGSFQMRNSTTNVWNSTLVPQVDTWYRIEWRVDNTNSQQQMRIFHGANLHGTTPDEDSGNQTYNQGTINRFVFGHEASYANVNTIYDDTAVDNSTWVGPVSLSTDWTETVPDSAGFTDSLAFDRVMEIANPLLGGDALTPAAGYVLAVTDNAGVADDDEAFLGTVVLPEDGEDITDSVSFARGLTVGDSLGVVDEDDEDLVAGGGSFTETPSDVLGITDGSPQFGWDGLGTDPVEVTDSVQVSKGFLEEDLGITDGAAQIGSEGTQTDPVSITDSFTYTKVTTSTILLNVTDDLGITEPDGGSLGYEVDEVEGLGVTDDIQIAFTPGIGQPEDLVQVTDEVAVTFTPDAGFNWTQDPSDLIVISDNIALVHVVSNDWVRTADDTITVTDVVELLHEGTNESSRQLTDVLLVTDHAEVTLTVLPPGRLRLVLHRSIRGPRLDDWFWRHCVMIPQPTQIALLVYPDGTVLETDDLLSDTARTAPFVAGGGHETILEPDSWQAQVLAAAGYELEPVT